MQLGMLADAVYGHGLGGQDGATMKSDMVAMYRGKARKCYDRDDVEGSSSAAQLAVLPGETTSFSAGLIPMDSGT